MTEWLFRIDAWLVALGFGLMMAAAWWVAGRVRARAPAAAEPGTTKSEEAILATLGLLLAFTFSIAVARHELRREAVVAEANAIGDFYTTSRLADAPARAQIGAAVRRYVELALELVQQPPDMSREEVILGEMAALRDSMVGLVRAAVRGGTPPPALIVLIQTLNDLGSRHEARVASWREHLPASVVALLLFASLLATVILRRWEGPTWWRTHAIAVAFIPLVSLVVFVTLDLNQPRRGIIRVSDDPMQRLLTSIEASESSRP